MSEKYFAQPSVMSAQSHFSQVPSAEIQRSTFDRSHGYKTTFDAGKLIPFFIDEVLPADTFNVNSTAFCRLATPLKPIMDNIYLDTHYFFVPYRLVWENWQQFCGEQKTLDDNPNDYTIPTIPFSQLNMDDDSPAAYMGMPQGTNAGTMSVSALPFRAYKLIWNEWYRDQNLQEPVEVSITSGTDPNTDFLGPCLPRGKRKDYFTSALPWPQKGDAVTIPLGKTAPVLTTIDGTVSGVHAAMVFNRSDGTTVSASALSLDDAGFVRSSSDGGTQETTHGFYPANLYTDLELATAYTINDLRTAFQIQRLLERDARGGTRYVEIILSHFGVRSDDARLQRPEYLGGGTAYVNINPIASTAPLPDAPQANLAAIGTSVGKSGFTKSFTEHGIVIGLMSARADLTYQQGIERFWSRKTRYDFYWPALAHLGEQAILQKEIYATGVPAEDDKVFGYQERYAEYRYKPSRITGKFASANPESLDVWHLSQEFDNAPVLNEEFIIENVPIDRIVAVPSEPDFLCDIWIKFKTTRPMPVYSVPGLIDHF
ncbi:major capsid protein [robinz microvirus RP_38]|nr:major capsid protein [robinz microvirus RP_38]